MLKLTIHPDTVERLASELGRAGRREIGGVLVGEHVGRNTFRIADISVQRDGGDRSCFIRRPEAHKGFMDDFFTRTGEAYERFNYLGEWHSHPSFTTEPSPTDVRQMMEIVTDGPDAPPFAVLMVVRLEQGRVVCTPCVFNPDGRVELAELVATPRPDHDPARPRRGWFSRWFGRPDSKPTMRLI